MNLRFCVSYLICFVPIMFVQSEFDPGLDPGSSQRCGIQDVGIIEIIIETRKPGPRPAGITAEFSGPVPGY